MLARLRPRGRRRLAVAALVLLVLVGGWFALARRAQEAVNVGSLRGLNCTEPDLARLDPSFRVSLVPGMDCRYAVDVTRPGRLPVRLVEVRYPGLGPRGALSARVDRLRWGGRTYEPVAALDDAVFRIDRVIPRSGFFQEAVAHLSYRSGTCTMAAGVTSRAMPLVSLRAFGWRREVHPAFGMGFEMDPERAHRRCPDDEITD